jgi:hypothetical protein
MRNVTIEAMPSRRDIGIETMPPRRDIGATIDAQQAVDVEQRPEALDVNIERAPGGGLGPPGPQGPIGPQGPPGLGALAGIQGSLPSPAMLPDPGAFVGQAFIIGDDLWVWRPISLGGEQ